MSKPLNPETVGKQPNSSRQIRQKAKSLALKPHGAISNALLGAVPKAALLLLNCHNAIIIFVHQGR